MFHKETGRKFWFPWRFVFVIPFLISWLNTEIIVSAQSRILPLELINKQSETCGQLDIIPSDIRTFAPWAVAIYRKTKGNKWTFHTSGSILGPGLIYSVQVGEAGRFPSDKNPGNFFIAAGINSTDFNSHDQHAQYSRVSLVVPQITGVHVYSHYVLYYLDAPLDVRTTPFVRDICFPFYASNSGFFSNLIEALQNSLRIEAIQFGFALSLKSKSKSKDNQERENFNFNSTKNLTDEKERKLKIWNIITLPQEQCQSIFRFYYGKSSSTGIWCGLRNTENVRGIFPVTKILEKFKTAESEDPEDEEFWCHGPGSSFMFTYGNGWFVSTPVALVPSLKKLRCSSKTVSVAALPPAKEVLEGIRGIFSAFKCPHGKVNCGNGRQCVNITQTCDEKADCEDSSDEDPILCEWKWKWRLKKEGDSFSFKNKRVEIQGEIKVNLTVDFDPRSANKRCPSLEFKTEGVRCRDPKILEFIDCQSPFFPGREILVDCDEFHVAPSFTAKSMNLFCSFGAEWKGLESIVCAKKCGIHNTGSKKSEKYTGFPWEAAIFKNGVHVCGASLIQDNFILSHSKCVKHWIEFPGKRSDFQVLIRPVSSNYQENLRSNFTHSSEIKDAWISVNDLKDKYESGIALIKLETPVLTNRENAPMAVCSLIPPFLKVSPWEIGKIFMSHPRKEGNRNFQVVPEKECDGILNGRSIISKNEFCAASNPPETGTENKTEEDPDFLRGSGLNFQVEEERVAGKTSPFALLGIASRIQEGRAVFLQVNSFSEWIIDILETNS